MRIEIEVNRQICRAEVPASQTLLEFVRDELGLTGSKEACGRGECGACTVLLGDRPVMSCATLAVEVRDPVTTIEGLGEDGSDIGAQFATHYGFQCGFCTSGQIVRAEALLRQGRPLDRQAVVQAMGSNICRCTGYAQIVDAVLATAADRGLLIEGEAP